MNVEHGDAVLTDKQATTYLNVNPQFLAKDRCTTRRIPFVRVGRSIRYLRSDLDAFIGANRVASR